MVTPAERRVPNFPLSEAPPAAQEQPLLRGRSVESLHVPAAPPVGAAAAAAEQAHIERFNAIVTPVRASFDRVRDGANLNALYNAMFTGENKTRFERDLSADEKTAVKARWITALQAWIHAHKPAEAPQDTASSVSGEDAPQATVAPRTEENFARDVKALPTAMQQQVVYVLIDNSELPLLHTLEPALIQAAIKGILRDNTAFPMPTPTFFGFVAHEFLQAVTATQNANLAVGDAVVRARFNGQVSLHEANLNAAIALAVPVLDNQTSNEQQKKEAMEVYKRAHLSYVSFAYAYQPRAVAPAAPPAAPVKVDLLYAFDLDRQADSIRHNRQKTRDMFRPLEETMLGGMFTAPVRLVWAVACAVQAATLAVFYRVRALFDRGETQVQTRAILAFKAAVQVELLTKALKDAGLALLFAFPVLGGISAIFYYKRQDITPQTRGVRAFQLSAPPPPPPPAADGGVWGQHTSEFPAPCGAPTRAAAAV